MQKKTATLPPTKAPTSDCPQAPTPWPPRGLSFEDRPGRTKPFLARWREPGGAKKCVGFTDASDRDSFARGWIKRREDWGKAAPLVHPKLVETWKIFREITDDADPLEVARFWLKYRTQRGGEMTVAEAVKRFLEIRATRKVAGDSASHLDLHMRRLVAFLGTRLLAEVTPDLIRAWLDALAMEKAPEWMEHRRAWVPMEGKTQLHHFRSAQQLFARAKAERWTEVDPTESVDPPDEEEKEITVLSVDEATALFSANKTSLVIGRLALEAFAGLRFTSAARIHRPEILMDEKGLVLPGAKHKSAAGIMSTATPRCSGSGWRSRRRLAGR